MNLVLYIGNTRTKWAIFQGDKLMDHGSVSKENELTFDWGALFNQASNSIISSVREDIGFLDKKYIIQAHTLSIKSKLSIKIDYDTPDTLGLDRLANAVAANSLHPHKNTLVLDMGTCIKLDMVDESGTYLGGSISPGLSMRCKALHQMTGKLPLITPNIEQDIIGTSTFGSLNSGVVNGIMAEINGLIEQYSNKFDDLHVIGTGGDFIFFADALKSSIFADTFLTLRGLNQILSYQRD